MNIFTTIVCFILSFILFEVKSESIGQLSISELHFKNLYGILLDGSCCPSVNQKCPGLCKTMISWCIIPKGLHHCKYLKTNNLGLNSINDGSISIPINTSWTGNFTLNVSIDHAERNGDRKKIAEFAINYVNLTSESTFHKASELNIGFKNELLIGYAIALKCDEHYFGTHCSKYCEPTDFHLGHHNCDNQGNKVCISGWTGEACTIAVCPDGCIHGQCTAPDICSCNDGWKGPTCSQCMTRPGCINGYCVTKAFQCNCYVKWGGLNCDEDQDQCSTNPCGENRICRNRENSSYICGECSSGFRGDNCDIVTNSCLNLPCQNQGTCISKGEVKYYCKCGPGFKGDHCEESTARKDEKQCYYHRLSRHFVHGESWVSKTCQNCSCWNGNSQCSVPLCEPGDCYNDVVKCPMYQSCSVPQTNSCLQPPCHFPVGRCLPTDLIQKVDTLDPLTQCRRNNRESKFCGHLFIHLNHSILPMGSNSASLCFDMMFALLSQRYNHISLNCSRVDTTSSLVVRVDMVSLVADFPISMVKESLLRVLHGKTNVFLPIQSLIRAIIRVSTSSPVDELTSTVSHRKLISESTPKTQSIFVPAVTVIFVLLALIVVMVIALFIFAPALRPKFPNIFPKNDISKNSPTCSKIVYRVTCCQTELETNQPPVVLPAPTRNVEMIQNNLFNSQLEALRKGDPSSRRAESTQANVESGRINDKLIRTLRKDLNGREIGYIKTNVDSLEASV